MSDAARPRPGAPPVAPPVSSGGADAGSVEQLGEVVRALAQAVELVLGEHQALAGAVRRAAAGTDAVDRLTEAVRGLRDDLAESHLLLADRTQTAVERVAGEQAERAMRILDAIGETGERTAAAVAGAVAEGGDTGPLLAGLHELRLALDGRQVVLGEGLAAVHDELAGIADQVRRLPTEPAPAPPPPDDSAVRSALAQLRGDLQRLEGELVAAAGQLRTDLAARLADRSATPTPVPAADLQGIYDRLGGIEWRLGERLDPLDERLAALEGRIESLRSGMGNGSGPDPRIGDRLAALEAGLEQVAQRDDLRRGVDRVLGAVSGSEQAVTGEVRAVDARVGAIAEEVRIVRVLRDGLEALSEGVDGVRQLTARAATSQQMHEVTRELGSVLAEIESARSHVLRVEQSSGPVAAEVVAVGTEVDDLGRRIDQLAEVIEDRMAGGDAGEQIAQRLRQVSATARQLGNGVLEDLRARRGRRR